MFNAIVIGWFLTVGWVPLQYDYLDYKAFDVTHDDLATVADVGFSVTFDDRLVIYTDVKSYQYKLTDSARFAPYRVNYTIGADFNLNDHVTISAKHNCNHEVINSDCVNNRYQSGETSISATIHGETRIK